MIADDPRPRASLTRPNLIAAQAHNAWTSIVIRQPDDGPTQFRRNACPRHRHCAAACFRAGDDKLARVGFLSSARRRRCSGSRRAPTCPSPARKQAAAQWRCRGRALRRNCVGPSSGWRMTIEVHALCACAAIKFGRVRLARGRGSPAIIRRWTASGPVGHGALPLHRQPRRRKPERCNARAWTRGVGAADDTPAGRRLKTVAWHRGAWPHVVTVAQSQLKADQARGIEKVIGGPTSSISRRRRSARKLPFTGSGTRPMNGQWCCSGLTRRRQRNAAV